MKYKSPSSLILIGIILFQFLSPAVVSAQTSAQFLSPYRLSSSGLLAGVDPFIAKLVNSSIGPNTMIPRGGRLESYRKHENSSYVQLKLELDGTVTFSQINPMAKLLPEGYYRLLWQSNTKDKPVTHLVLNDYGNLFAVDYNSRLGGWGSLNKNSIYWKSSNTIIKLQAGMEAPKLYLTYTTEEDTASGEDGFLGWIGHSLVSGRYWTDANFRTVSDDVKILRQYNKFFTKASNSIGGSQTIRNFQINSEIGYTGNTPPYGL